MFMWSYKPFFLCLVLSVSSFSEIIHAQVSDEPVQEIRHHVGGWSEELQAYQVELLNIVLRLSEAEFGAYRLLVDERKLSDSRWRIGISKGDIHSSFKSFLPSSGDEGVELSYLLYPFAKSLLGFRRLIIRKEDVDKFAQVKGLSDLTKFRVGQGRFWPDTWIYNEAGMHVVPGESLDELFPMLKKKRFDFLPLSVLEVDDFFAKKTELRELTIAENISIFYPIPVYLVVAKSAPNIEARYTAGLSKLYSPDSRHIVDELFMRHFQVALHLPQDSQTLVIKLDNARIPKDVSQGISSYMNRNFCLFPKSCFVKK